MGTSDWADWCDRQKRESEEILGGWVVENPQWWAIGVATGVQTAMELGQGFVDVLRLGQGTAEGTLGGVGKDALRLLALLGPLARGGAIANRTLAPLLRAPRLRVAVQVTGVEGPCTFQAVNNSLSVTRGKNLFVTVQDMARALGLSLKTVGKNLRGDYKIAAWIDDLIPVMRKLGAKVKTVNGLKSIDDVVNLAKSESGPVVFAFKVKAKLPDGTTDDILHSVIAFRNAAGRVRFADYGGKFVNSLDDLIKHNLGLVPLEKPQLLQANVSAAVVDGAAFTGAWASKLAKGAFLVLQGWAAIDTPNGVELAAPATRAAAVSNIRTNSAQATPSPEVLKGSFEACKNRRKGVVSPTLSTWARDAGGRIAPPSGYLTGVQFRLNALGFAAGVVDGVMGPVTRGATMRFQRAEPKLSVDGIPGPRTQRALVAACGY